MTKSHHRRVAGFSTLIFPPADSLPARKYYAFRLPLPADKIVTCADQEKGNAAGKINKRAMALYTCVGKGYEK